MAEDFDLEAIRRRQKRRAAVLRKEFRRSLDATLANSDGLARLRGLTDAEWQGAVDADAETVEQEAGGA